MYELQYNIIEGLLPSIYDNYIYKGSDCTIIWNFMDIREDTHFYKFKLALWTNKHVYNW